MPNYNNEKRILDLPNINLPFFAYGIFKPGQLAYSKIRNHVDEYNIKNVEITYEMKHRDGVPVLINKESDYHKTKGSILTFRKGQEEETYNIICKTLLRKLYKWETIKINGEEVNILFGVDPKKGSDYIENPEDRINFNGKNDPFFNEAIDLIEKNLNSEKNPWKIESFFELQMNYMLLWSSIDRFCSLKYNQPKDSKNHEKFARQKAFRKGIKNYENKLHYPVYSTDDLKIHNFNAEDSTETIRYYYTFRCNVVHRGKAILGDYDMLKTAAEELLELFKDVLNDTFNEK